MAKIVLDSTDGTINIHSISAVASTLARVIGDDITIRKSVTIESSDAVIKAIEVVLASVKAKASTKKSA
jgi:hypothetical protein